MYTANKIDVEVQWSAEDLLTLELYLVRMNGIQTEAEKINSVDAEPQQCHGQDGR